MPTVPRIYGLSVDDFFEYWKEDGDFIKAVKYIPLAVYGKGDIVAFNAQFWISLVDNNTTPPLSPSPTPLWNIVAVGNFVLESLVKKQMQFTQGSQLFSIDLFNQTLGLDNQPIQSDAIPPVNTFIGFTFAQQGFILLTSHFIKLAQFANQYDGQAYQVIDSESVGSVSHNFSFDEVSKKSKLFKLESTEYGKQYTQMIQGVLRTSTFPFFC